MAGYVIANVVWKDPEGFAAYSRLLPPSLKRYGGRVLVGSQASEVMEGAWNPARLVVIEFPRIEQARRW